MKKETVAAGMVGVLTFSGASSAVAEIYNTESVNGGDKRVVLKDENLSIANRYDNEFKRLGIEAPFLADASSEIQERKITFDKKIIFQIDEPYYMVYNANVPGEENIFKGDTCPIILNSRTMVPLRLIGEALGADVNWDGETSSITLKKESKEIKTQIGNNLMKINDGNDVKEFVLDSPPIIDKNNRTLVPVRAIAEGFGVKVLWDEKTRSVLINYTEEEKNNLFSNTTETEISADAIDLNCSYQASRFMAGGEYMNVAEEGPFAIKDKQSGAVVVFSDQDFLNIDGTISLIEKHKFNVEELHQLYIDKSIVNNIKDRLNSNDCVYVLNGEAYVFNDENLKQGNKTLIKYDANGNQSIIINDKAGMFYFSKLAFDKNLGVFAFDGTKITHKLNTQTKQFDELSTPEFVGTLQQRTIHNLEAAYNGKNGNVLNPLGLDYQDILEYKNTGSDKNCKSFKLIKVSDNLGFVCLTGGQCGLQMEKSLENLKLFVKRVNEIDPIISQNWVNRGLDFFATDQLPGVFFKSDVSKKWIASYYTYGYNGRIGVIYFNENGRSFARDPVGFFTPLDVESNGLKFQSHSSSFMVATIDGVVYTDSQAYKANECRKTAAKYLPPDWDGKWDGYKPLKEVFPNWDWRTQGKY